MPTPLVREWSVPVYSCRLVRDREIPGSAPILYSPRDVARFAWALFEEADREMFAVAFLSQRNQVTGLHVVSVGGLSASIVEPRAVFKAAVLANAASLVCLHNHPSGNPEPSREDVAITKQLVEAGKLMGVPVLDHLILCSLDAYTSLSERGLV